MGLFSRDKRVGMLRWAPQKDITTYELALCVGAMVVGTQQFDSLERRYNELPPEAQRHFKMERDE